jgi:WhiB family redox-sensing transcriptional regulator
MDWRQLAACRDEEPELFFPARDSGPASAQVRQAKRICANCSVQEDCLAAAMTIWPLHGVWGGKSESERLALRPHLKDPAR